MSGHLLSGTSMAAMAAMAPAAVLRIGFSVTPSVWTNYAWEDT